MADRHTLAAHRAARNLPLATTYQEQLETPPATPIEAQKTDISFWVAGTFIEAGYQAARAGWNGKGMFVALHTSDEDGYDDYLVLRTVAGSVVPWLPSQTDILAKDWQILEGGQIIVASGA